MQNTSSRNTSSRNTSSISSITNLTLQDDCDIIELNYTSWEDIPVAELKFNSTSEQIVYISIKKKDAPTIFSKKAINTPIKAYEYKENISFNDKENVIVAVVIDTRRMLDLTNRKEYKAVNKFSDDIKSLIKDLKENKNVALIRRIKPIELGISFIGIIEYIILDNSAIKDIIKIK